MGKDIEINATAQNGMKIPVIIPPGASLQEPPTESAFPDIVFSTLPPLLKSSCDVLADQTEKEVFLVSSLGVISGILLNVHGFYDGSFVAPNLFCFIVGGYGSGKGGLKYSRLLAQPIHMKLREESKALQADYKQQCIDAKESGEAPPDPPPQKMMFIPANNSKTGVVDILEQNGGRGVVYETEADTLAGALKTDYGDFSDVLRKGAHGEPIDIYRRTNKEHISIEKPAFSVVITGTPDQVLKLIPTAENGLFSRFMFYRLCPSTEFKDVFSDTRRNYPAHFEGAGQMFLEMYLYLETLQTPIEFRLTASQQTRFVDIFKQIKKDLLENASPDLGGVANRQGLQVFRVAMILTALRSFGHGDYSQTLVCSDIDFENALRIVEILRGHSLGVYYDLPQAPTSRNAAAYQVELSQKAGDVARSKVLFEQGRSYAEIAKEILGDATKKGTVYKWLNRK